MKLIYLLITAIFLASCVSANDSEQEMAHRKMRTLSSKLKKQEREIERLKAKNVVLSGSRKSNAIKRRSISDRARLDLSSMTQTDAYQNLISFYKAGDESSLKAGAKKFIRKYPDSSYNDNLYYMIGSIKLKNKDYVKSIKFFDKVAKSYPTQDKAPYAIFAKGLVYKKLGLNDQARSAFNDVAKKYPSTPAAKKAMVEIKTVQ